MSRFDMTGRISGAVSGVSPSKTWRKLRRRHDIQYSCSWKRRRPRWKDTDRLFETSDCQRADCGADCPRMITNWCSYSILIITGRVKGQRGIGGKRIGEW